MKRYLEKLSVFKLGLRISSFLALRKFYGAVKLLTGSFAWVTLKLNKPKKTSNIHELAKTWVDLMPPDGRDYFEIASVEEETAYLKINLKCPLRGTGDVAACHKVMNYDRKLMKNVGANLVILESQSNSGKSCCKLAIRKIGIKLDDLVPAHKLQSKT